MGILQSDVLEFDTDNLRTQATRIGKVADDLEDAKKALDSNLTDLRNDWQTKAGDKFFKQYDSKWISQVDNYVKLLRDLVTELNYAATEYDSIKL